LTKKKKGGGNWETAGNNKSEGEDILVCNKPGESQLKLKTKGHKHQDQKKNLKKKRVWVRQRPVKKRALRLASQQNEKNKRRIETRKELVGHHFVGGGKKKFHGKNREKRGKNFGMGDVREEFAVGSKRGDIRQEGGVSVRNREKK